MAPVVQGVADGLAQDFGVFLELLPVGGVAGDVFFRHARAAHQTPLVVIAAQPDPGDVIIADVLENFPGVQVAVIIDDRLLFRRFVIQDFRRFRVQQEVFVQELFHGPAPFSHSELLVICYRLTRALPFFMIDSTSSLLAMLVSPGVVMARAPWAAP